MTQLPPACFLSSLGDNIEKENESEKQSFDHCAKVLYI